MLIVVRTINTHPSYAIWRNLRARCYNPNSVNYSNYGARGIEVYEDWLDKTRVKIGEYIGVSGRTYPIKWPAGFLRFLEHVGERPEGYQLDRIDNSKGYEPGNVRWATVHEQAANRRTSNEVVGISFDSDRRRWRASLTVSGNRVLSRTFASKSEAIVARKKAEVEFAI